MTEAWCLAGGKNGVPLEATPGRRVSASRAHARLKDRLEYLRQERASILPEIDTSADFQESDLREIMESVTATLIAASEQARNLGHQNLATALRSELTTHAGRRARVESRTKEVVKLDPQSDVIIDDLKARFFRCVCDD